MKVELEIPDKVWASFCLMSERNGLDAGELAAQVLWGTVMMQDPALRSRVTEATEQMIAESPEFKEKWDRMKPDYLE